jgi:hypothetical protein
MYRTNHVYKYIQKNKISEVLGIFLSCFKWLFMLFKIKFQIRLKYFWSLCMCISGSEGWLDTVEILT